MTIENQCCTSQQAKRLKELGIKQESQFYWLHDKHLSWGVDKDSLPEDAYLSLFSVAELGLMLPQRFCSFRQDFLHYKDVWICDLSSKNPQYGAWYGYMDYLTNDIQTEAQARAQILIYLLEHNISTAEEVNARLVNEEQKQVQ